MKKQRKQLAARSIDDGTQSTDEQREVEQMMHTALAGYLRGSRSMVELSNLPWVFEWTIVPGPDTLQ